MATTELNRLLCDFFRSESFEKITSSKNDEDQKAYLVAQQIFEKLAAFLSGATPALTKIAGFIANDVSTIVLCRRVGRTARLDDGFLVETIREMFFTIVENIDRFDGVELRDVAAVCANLKPSLTAIYLSVFGAENQMITAVDCWRLDQTLHSPPILIDQKLEAKIGNQALIYGFGICGYRTIKSLLDASLFPYGYEGAQYEPGEQNFRNKWLSGVHGKTPKVNTFLFDAIGMTLQKKCIKMDLGLNSGCSAKQKCKQVLTSFVLHTVLFPEDKISIIFCVQLTKKDGTKISPSVQEMFDQGKYPVTTAELKRIYKLCYCPEVPDVIRKTAQQIVTFVNVTETDQKDRYVLTQAETPWRDSEWKKAQQNTTKNLDKKAWIQTLKNSLSQEKT